MTITRFSTGAIRDNALATNTSFAASDMELIGTIRLNSNTASVTFSGIPQEYKHLQLRATAMETAGANGMYFNIRINGDSGSNYAFHRLSGNGATASSGGGTSQTFGQLGPISGPTSNSNPTVFVWDILDYSNASKYKTTRSLCGCDNNGSGSIDMFSNLWMSTAAVTSVIVYSYSQGSASNFGSQSKFALYGIRG